MKTLFPKNLYQKWDEILAGATDVLLATHVNPDGDALGAITGLGSWLRDKGYSVSMICPNAYPSFLEYLDRDSRVVFYAADTERARVLIDKAQLIIALDVSSLNRMDDLGEELAERAVPKILIDHHLEPSGEDFELIFSCTEVSSTCELVYRILKTWKPRTHLSKEQAVSLMTGLITDTNQFANSVLPQTLEVAAHLMRYGADINQIYALIYGTFSYSRMKLMGLALQKITILPQFGAGYIVLSKKDLEGYDFQNGDTEGFVNLPLAIKGISVSAFFLEKDDYIKVSLRSRGDIPVNIIAKRFYSGGGHLNAAAGKSLDPVEMMEPVLVKALGTIIA